MSFDTWVRFFVDPTGARKGANEIKNALNEVRDTTKDTIQSMKGFGGLGDILTPGRLGLASLAGAAIYSTKAFADNTNELRANAAAAGLTIKELQGLQHAFIANGTPIEQINSLLFGFSKTVTEAVSGAGDGAQLFEQMGIKIRDSNNHVKSQADLFLEVRDRFSQYEEGANKITLLQQVMGRGARDSVKVFNMQGDAFRQLVEEGGNFRKVTNDDVEAGQVWAAELNRLKETTAGLGDAVGRELLPHMVDLMKTMSDMAKGDVGTLLGDWIKGIRAEFTLLGSTATKAAGWVGLLWENIQHPLNIKQNTANFNELMKTFDLINEKTEETMRNMFEGPKKELKAPDIKAGKMEAPVKMDTALLKAGLEEQIKAIDEATKREIDIRKAGAEILEEMQNTNVALRVTKESDALTAIQQIKRDETAAAVAALDKQRDALKGLLEKNKGMYAEGTKERLAFEREMNDKLDKNRDERTKVEREGQKQELVSARQINQAKEQEQERLGAALIANWTSYYQTTQAMRQRDLDDDVKVAQARANASHLNLESREKMAAAEMDVLEAQHKKAIAAEGLTAKERLAIEIDYKAKKDELQRQQTDGFVEGWRKALHTYVEEQNVFFNIGQDMVKEAQQAMSSGIDAFVNKGLRGQITTAEEMLEGFRNFATNISSKIISELATQAIMSGLSGASSGGGGMGSWSSLFGKMGGMFGSSAGSTGGSIGGLAGPAGDVGGFALAARGGYFPVKKYAAGGISRSPEVRVVGEGTGSEAVVPLPDGQTIPVTLKGEQKGSMAPVIELTILNQITPPTGGGQNLTKADIINIIDGNSRDNGQSRKAIRKAAR